MGMMGYVIVFCWGISYLLVEILKARTDSDVMSKSFNQKENALLLCSGLFLFVFWNMSVFSELPINSITEFLVFGVYANVVAQFLFIFYGLLLLANETLMEEDN